jgi:hypothetical protein
MPGGNDNEVNALYEIACNTLAMAGAAGGTPPSGGYVNDESALVQQIACNILATNQALGGVCVPLWVDEMTAWQAILQMSVEMASLTGTPSDQGFYELPQTGIFCNLQQVAINTGQAAEGDFGGNEGDLTLLNSIACVTAQIAANGFAPPDPVQVFINSLLAYNPDVLLVGDRVSGPIVATWPDQSGHGASATPVVGAVAPTKNVASINGHNSVLFDGSSTELEGAYVNNTAFSSVFVVFRNAGSPIQNGNTYVTTAAAPGGSDATVGQPVLIYNDSSVSAHTAFYGGVTGGFANSVENTFRLGTGITDGSTSHIWDDGSTVTTGAYTGPLATTLYCLGATSNLQGARFLTGDIALVVLFKSDQTANRVSIEALINAYYGL